MDFNYQEEKFFRMKIIKILLLSFAFVSAVAGHVQFVFAKDARKPIATLNKTPKYESYPAKVVYAEAQPPLVLATKLAKRYKTVITEESAKPVNFAGHYRVATWGCGTDCRGFAIINKQTGAVYTLPGLVEVAGVMGIEEDRLAFKADSRLFVITGIQNDSIEGKFFYLWEKEKLRLLAKHPILKQDAVID